MTAKNIHSNESIDNGSSKNNVKVRDSKKHVKHNKRKFYIIPKGGMIAEVIQEPEPTVHVNEGYDNKNKKREPISIPAFVSRRGKFSRMPIESPVSKTGFGQKLGQLVVDMVSRDHNYIEKVASGAISASTSGPRPVLEQIRVGKDNVSRITETDLKKKFGANKIISTFENIYDSIDYTRMHDSFRADGQTRTVIMKKVGYTLGETTDIEFVPHVTVTDTEEKTEIQQQINENKLLMSLRDELKEIDEEIDLYLNSHGFLIQFLIYGAGLAGVERDKYGIPLAIKILSTMSQGRHFRDAKTWKLLGIEYLDYPKEDQESGEKTLANVLLNDDILYLANIPYNILPNTYGFGISEIEPICHIAEQNVILNQMDIKEGNKMTWTPSYIAYVKNPDSPNDVTNLKNAAEESNVIYTELDCEPRLINNVTDMTQLVEERQMNDEAIARYADVPALIAGLERIQVKAAGSQVLFAWTQSSLLKLREVIRIYFQRAYYLRNLKAVIWRRLKRLGIAIDKEPENPLSKLEINRDVLEADRQRRLDRIKNQQEIERQFQTANEQTDEERQQEPFRRPPKVEGEGEEVGEPKLSENGLRVDENGEEVIPEVSDFKSITDFIPYLEHLDKLPFIIKMTFKTITIDGLLEKAATTATLKQSGIIDNRYSWKILDFQDLLANPPAHLLLDEQITTLEDKMMFEGGGGAFGFGQQAGAGGAGGSSLSGTKPTGKTGPQGKGDKGKTGLGDFTPNATNLVRNRGKAKKPALEVNT